MTPSDRALILELVADVVWEAMTFTDADARTLDALYKSVRRLQHRLPDTREAARTADKGEPQIPGYRPGHGDALRAVLEPAAAPADTTAQFERCEFCNEGLRCDGEKVCQRRKFGITNDSETTGPAQPVSEPESGLRECPFCKVAVDGPSESGPCAPGIAYREAASLALDGAGTNAIVDAVWRIFGNTRAPVAGTAGDGGGWYEHERLSCHLGTRQIGNNVEPVLKSVKVWLPDGHYIGGRLRSATGDAG